MAPLPGSERVYDPARKDWEAACPPNRPSYLPFGGGWLVGVAARPRARSATRAIDFARYLISPETSNRVRADRAFPMLPVRSAQLRQGLPDPRAAPGVDVAAMVRRGQPDPRRRAASSPACASPRPTATSTDLARGRAAAVGASPPRRALKEVAAGLDRADRGARAPQRQLWHYRRSLNTPGHAARAPDAEFT